MKDDELQIFTSFDQSLDVNEDWMLEKVQDIIQTAIREKDVNIALTACKTLIAVTKLSGKGLAKLLYLLRENWDKFECDETFEEVIYAQSGLHAYTVNRYIAVYENIYVNPAIPAEVAEDIQQKGIKELIPIAMALNEGYEIDNQAWERLRTAPDLNTVLHIVREDVKEIPPRKGTIQLQLDEVGTIWAFCDGERYFVGSLEITDTSKVIQSAIRRIVRGAGIRGINCL